MVTPRPTPATTLQLGAAPRARAADGRWLDLAPLDGLLLAWLALEGPTPRERLAALLWPDSDAEAARNALRQRLFRLRRQCGRDLVTGNTLVQLADGEGHDLGDAGGLLGDLAPPPQEALAAWLQASRARRAGLARQADIARLDALEAAGTLDTALTVAAGLVDADPLSEEAHRRVMRLHYLRGDRAAALLAFDRLEALLRHEVGTKPGAATLELLRTIEAAGGAAAPVVQRQQLPASVLRPPRLVGRDAELQALHAAWAAGQTVLLVGDAGMGKSRLLQAVAARADGLVVAAARPGDTLVPYASFARLAQQLLARVPGLLDADLRPRLAPLLPALSAMAAPPPVRGSAPLLEPLQRLLARAQPGIDGLLLDDLHFADDASLELLQGLLCSRRASGQDPGRPGERWLLGLRPPVAGSRLGEFVAAVTAALPLVQLPLQPLDAAQVAELVDSLALAGISGAAIGAALWQRSGGNPLFALETLKVAWADGSLVAGGELPRPPSLQQLIGQQLVRLTPPALALARLAAVAGSDFSLPLAEQVLGQRALQLVEPWQELEARQVMVGGEFAHDLVFEAVHDGLPAPIARHLHAQIADWLEEHGGEPARLAAHWEAAGQRERALPWLRAAADRAHRALREGERIGFLLRAADIAEGSGRRGEAFECLAQAVASHMNALREAGGFPLLDRLDHLAGGGAERARALGLRAWYCSQLGDLQQAVACGEQALALVGPLLDARPADSTAPAADAAALAALAGGIRQRLATALAMLGRFDDALPHFEAMQAWAESHLASDDLAEFHGNFAVALDNLGRPAQALPQHRRAIAACERAGNHSQRATQLANQAVSRLNAGDVAGAEALLVQAQQLIQAFDLQGSSAGFVAVLRMQCCRAFGRYREALALADHAEAVLAAALPARVPVVWLHRAHCWLDLGQYARAQQALTAAETGLPPHSEARRLLLLARWQRALAQDATATLERAAATAPRRGWPEVAMLVAAEQAAAEPATAGPKLPPVLRQAREFGLQGAVLALLARLADAGDATAAGEAMALAATGVQPALLTPASLHLACARGFEAAGETAAARAALAAGRRWLDEVAGSHVEAAFRDSFLCRQPDHALLFAGITRARVTPV